MAVVNRMGWTMFRIWRASKQKKLETVRKSPNMVAFIYQTMGIYPGYTQFASVFIVFAMLCLALLTTVTGPGDQPWWMGMYCNTQTWYVGLSNVFNRETWSCRCFIFCDKKSMWLPEESPDSANDIAESHLTVLSFRTNISADMTKCLMTCRILIDAGISMKQQENSLTIRSRQHQADSRNMMLVYVGPETAETAEIQLTKSWKISRYFCPIWSSWGSSLYGKPGAWPCCCWKWWRWTELGVVQTWSLFDDLTHPNWDFKIFFRIGSWIKLMESTKTGVSKIMASCSFMILHFFMFEFSFACFSTFYQQLSTNYMTFWCILSRMKKLCWNHRLVAGVYHHKTSLARLVWVESSQ